MQGENSQLEIYELARELIDKRFVIQALTFKEGLLRQ